MALDTYVTSAGNRVTYHTLRVSLKPSELRALRAYAKDHNTTMAAVVRGLIRKTDGPSNLWDTLPR